ncbi:CBS domain-containing protein [Maridesulfovibrio sp.]|uniref:CBS domain-containing protein n=1 Tax=Maridesulfovibrio sp. TaxID=2795000 RepID=UPI002A187F91|nr:CBS domain-containing protein [Maridesulfovibrio sp.]
MKNFKAKDLMIPADEYCRVKKDTTLHEAMAQLVIQSEKKGLSHPHRDLLVEDEEGKIIGKVTMLDIFKSMEPNYFKKETGRHQNALTREYVQKIYTDFNLWSEPLSTLCQKCAALKVSELMHTPHLTEMINEDDSIDKALHSFVLGLHQPILVQKDGNVTGVLRLGDIFENIRKAILACEIETA